MNNETVFHRWFLLRGVEMKRALVLGGAGAKGAAHVGVIRALEEKGFVPDLIVGVSIDALSGRDMQYWLIQIASGKLR